VDGIGKQQEDLEGLLRPDNDGPVGRLAPGFHGLHRIDGQQLMQNTGFVRPRHYAADLRNGTPRQPFFLVQYLEPSLNFRRLDVCRNGITESRDKVVVADVLHILRGCADFRPDRSGSPQ